MARESTRGNYRDPAILEDPAFAAALEDSRAKNIYDLFLEWIDGERPAVLAERYGICLSTVQSHLQRTRAIYCLFAGREMNPSWEKNGLDRNIRTRTAIWRGNPEATGRQLTKVTACFNRYYKGCTQRPELLLAMATDEGLRDIPRTGPKNLELYLNARDYAVKEMIRNGELERLEGLINLRNLIQNSRSEDDHTPVDLAMAKLMDCGIFDEDDFYKNGWKPLFPNKHGKTALGINPLVLRRAYQKALKRRHPDVKDPMLVLITAIQPGGQMLIRKCMYGVPEEGIKDILQELQQKGWQTGMSGRPPAMPARIIQIRKGDI